MQDSEQLQKLWVKKKILNLQWMALKWKGSQHLWFTKQLSCFCINCSLDAEQSKKTHENFSSQLSGEYPSLLSHIYWRQIETEKVRPYLKWTKPATTKEERTRKAHHKDLGLKKKLHDISVILIQSYVKCICRSFPLEKVKLETDLTRNCTYI